MLTEHDLFRDCASGDDAYLLDLTLDREFGFSFEPAHHASILRALAVEHNNDVLQKYVTDWQAMLRIAIGAEGLQPPLPGLDETFDEGEAFARIRNAKVSRRYLELVGHGLSGNRV